MDNQIKPILRGEYKGIEFSYTPIDPQDECNGVLDITHRNGVKSTHRIENWSEARVFQYIVSFNKVV